MATPRNFPNTVYVTALLQDIYVNLVNEMQAEALKTHSDSTKKALLKDCATLLASPTHTNFWHKFNCSYAPPAGSLERTLIRTSMIYNAFYGVLYFTYFDNTYKYYGKNNFQDLFKAIWETTSKSDPTGASKTQRNLLIQYVGIAYATYKKDLREAKIKPEDTREGRMTRCFEFISGALKNTLSVEQKASQAVFFPKAAPLLEEPTADDQDQGPAKRARIA